MTKAASQKTKLKIIAAIALVLLLITFALLRAPEPPREYDYLSPSVIAYMQNTDELIVTAKTADMLIFIDRATQKVTRRVYLPISPTGVAISQDEKTIYITAGGYDGAVFIVDAESEEITARINVGHTPLSPVISKDGNTLYIAEQFHNSVSFINLKTQKAIARIRCEREPHAIALSPDGSRIFVANLLSNSPATDDYNASAVTVIDVKTKSVAKQIRLPNGTNTLRDITLSPDGRHAYVSCVIGRYQVPTSQIERGWIYTNGISILDVTKETNICTVLLDDVDRGASNPWGVACSEDGSWLCVTHAGTHEISVIDRVKLHQKIKEREREGKLESILEDLSFIAPLRRRIPLLGNGPRGVVCVSGRAYVAEYFSDSLSGVVLHPDIQKNTKQISLGVSKPMSQVRLGEMYFNDASQCFQEWQSCVSCHPDSRSDSLNWDLLNDGIGNPKQSKSMLYSHLTPPVMALGVRAKAEVAVRAGMRHIQFAVRPEADAVAIDEYLKSLKPLKSIYLVDGEMSPKAIRGEAIFKKAGCASCHPAPLYTDKQMRDVGTGTGADLGKAFDTPSLIEIWRSSPYLHDGRALDIRDVITKHNPNNSRGNTQDLSETEIDELVEFIMSL